MRQQILYVHEANCTVTNGVNVIVVVVQKLTQIIEGLPNYLISCFLFLFLLFFFCWLQKTTHFRKPQAISGKGQIHPWRLMDLFPVSNLHTSSHTINKSLLCLLILSYQSFPPNSDTNESVLWSMQVNLIYQWN